MRTEWISVTPDRCLQPEAVAIKAGGFPPGQSVTLSARLVDDAGMEWRSHGVFLADAEGIIDLPESPSEEGTFIGVDPEGLFWSMQPPSGTDPSFLTEAKAFYHQFGRPQIEPLDPVRIQLSAQVDGGVAATAEMTFDRVSEEVEVKPVHDGRLRDLSFTQRDRTKARGAIMSLTGSGGGVETGYAPLLASLGYDVLSLAYFAYEDLPSTITSLPLEYFEEGFEWMRTELGAGKIAVQGASRGGELSLLLASYFPEHVCGTVAIVPMFVSSAGWDPKGSVSGPSWTFRGEDIPYAESTVPSVEEMRGLAEGQRFGYAATPAYLKDFQSPGVRERCAIPVERASGPILLISGEDDQMWPSRWGSDLVINRLRAAGFPHRYSHLAAIDTGHFTPLPHTITTFCRAVYHSLAGIYLACGGTPAGSARESRKTWDALKAHYAAVFG